MNKLCLVLEKEEIEYNFWESECENKLNKIYDTEVSFHDKISILYSSSFKIEEG